MNDQDVVIVSAVRTAIGSFNGSLANVPAIDLGSTVINSALNKLGLLENEVDEVIMGNVLSAGLGQNPARQAALKAGLPYDVPAMTINKVCGSGLKAVHLGAQSIKLEEHSVVICGGMENMSKAPYLLEKARSGYRMGDGKVKDSMISEGLWCAINDYHMGVTAENLCKRYRISREEQDEFAVNSQIKAETAMKLGVFEDEIVPVVIRNRKEESLFDRDEYIKRGTTIEALSKLRPAFCKEGSVTAGNASGINDGAAAVILMSRKKAKELGIKPLAVIRANGVGAVDPSVMGIGPVPAVRNALKKSGLTISEIDLIEANEAFAVQALAVCKELELDREKVNVNGGAIALGHPIGSSGTRILVSLVHEMKRRRSRYGLATLCIGGGQGIATIIEREE